MQEAQLVIEQLIWLTNLSENIVKPQNTDENLKKSQTLPGFISKHLIF
jgi:hypothetical protein